MISADARLAQHSGNICLVQLVLTAEDVKLVQDSFQMAAPQALRASELFYKRLFEIAPESKALFHDTAAAQRQKFAQMLALLVQKLRAPADINEILQELGRRHAGYDVRPEHYEKAREALVWTLAELLGADFDAKTRAAWTAAFQAFATVMQCATVSQLPEQQFYKTALRSALVAHYGAEKLPLMAKKPA
jgi:hemoglobin-like flavoprotein